LNSAAIAEVDGSQAIAAAKVLAANHPFVLDDFFIVFARSYPPLPSAFINATAMMI